MCYLRTTILERQKYVEMLFFVQTGVKLKLLSPDVLPQASMTGGMVQEYSHVVLPSVPPAVTLIATLLTMFVSFTFCLTCSYTTCYVSEWKLCACPSSLPNHFCF